MKGEDQRVLCVCARARARARALFALSQQHECGLHVWRAHRHTAVTSQARYCGQMSDATSMYAHAHAHTVVCGSKRCLAMCAQTKPLRAAAGLGECTSQLGPTTLKGMLLQNTLQDTTRSPDQRYPVRPPHKCMLAMGVPSRALAACYVHPLPSPRAPMSMLCVGCTHINSVPQRSTWRIASGVSRAFAQSVVLCHSPSGLCTCSNGVAWCHVVTCTTSNGRPPSFY